MDQRTTGEQCVNEGSHLVEVKRVQQVVELAVFLRLLKFEIILLEAMER